MQTSYRLETVSQKLISAEELEQKGLRGLAVAVVETAQQMLPADHAREHEYLEIVKATIWARDGDGRDAVKAGELLQPVANSAKQRADQRMLADIELARVVLLLAAGDKVGAARSGDAALRGFTTAEAHARSVEAARELAFQFLYAEDVPTARGFARRAYATTQRLEDDELLIQTCLDIGRIELVAGVGADDYFLQAYEAAYRIDSLGWRNVVIAVAADAWYSHGDMKACIRWGDRIRTRADSSMPALADTGLYAGDYITLLAQQAFAQDEVSKGSARGKQAAELALATIAALPKPEQEQWSELAENLRAGLLQPQEEK